MMKFLMLREYFCDKSPQNHHTLYINIVPQGSFEPNDLYSATLSSAAMCPCMHRNTRVYCSSCTLHSLCQWGQLREYLIWQTISSGASESFLVKISQHNTGN